MKKITLKIDVDERVFEATKTFIKDKKGVKIETIFEEYLIVLYSKFVPKDVRKYIGYEPENEAKTSKENQSDKSTKAQVESNGDEPISIVGQNHDENDNFARNNNENSGY